MAELMTPAPILDEAPHHRPTGNLQVHLAANDPDRPRVWRAGVVSLGLDGILDLVGAPLLEVVGEGWRGRRVLDWLPAWESAERHVILLTPWGQRGAVLRIEPKGPGPIEVRGKMARLVVGRFSEEVLDAQLVPSRDSWTGSFIVSACVGRTLLALALRPDQPPEMVEWGPDWCMRFSGDAPIHIYVGLAPESDGARTTALHLCRVGWDELYRHTEARLAALAAGGPEGDLAAVYRRNLYFGYFYSQAETVEGATALMTSRSPHYYVSGAYWARDSLLWFFPMLLDADPERAGVVLETAFERYAPWPGEHAQYLSGSPLYPGFELDEAAAYLLALASYLERDGERHLLLRIARRLDRVFDRIRAERHSQLALYRTFLSPTDDPVPHPYLVYDNALLSVGLERLTPFLEGALRDWAGNEARDIRAAVYRHGTTEGPLGRMFAFAFEPDGPRAIGDEPAGSLALLAHLGFCTADDPLFRTTVRWIHSEHNAYHFHGTFCGEGSAHFPFPSGFSIANRLLLGESPWRDEALQVLREAPLDAGLVPESYDPSTGRVRTGAAFATLAAFVAHALRELAA